MNKVCRYCPICNSNVTGHTLVNGTCSPECARTKAIVDAIKGIETMIAARLPEPQQVTVDPAFADMMHEVVEPFRRTIHQGIDPGEFREV